MRSYFPKLGTDLVSALSALDVNDFSHGCETFVLRYKFVALVRNEAAKVE